MLTRRAACCLEGRRPPRVVVHFSKDTAQIADYMAQISVAEKETREEMSAVFSYRCFEGCGKIHQLPGRIGEQPPKRVTCPNCGKECLRT